MSFADTYLEKHHFLMPRIKAPPSRGLWYVVVIPAYLEEHIFHTLESLRNTQSIDDSIEVLVVVNYPEVDTQANKTANQSNYKKLKKWCEENSDSSIRFFTIFAPDLPAKHAGAGLARKIGMDEALYRFGLIDNPEGVILSLDADTLVDRNYFSAIAREFKFKSNYGGCILPFAHPVERKAFPSKIYDAIMLYELHLRYYKNALQFSGFPYAHYTIGSCFGVRAGFYAQQGGMNRKKAGEDFYFLNKLFPHRDFCEIKMTCVYPSPRPSQRVPFGTGPVIQKLVDSGTMQYFTYNLQAFIDLKSFFGSITRLYSINDSNFDYYLSNISESLKTFLIQNDFPLKLKEIKENTASESAFYKRFFLWFDGFRVVKFLNYSHKEHYRKLDVTEAVKKLLILKKHTGFKEDPRSLLLFLRRLDNNR